MIEDANLSYKKISSHPKCYINEAIQEARVLFSIKFIQVLTLQTLLLNVDETVIGRNRKLSYSWSHKGKIQECQNVGIFGHTKLILIIASNGL